jgi:hypothetical protein
LHTDEEDEDEEEESNDNDNDDKDVEGSRRRRLLPVVVESNDSNDSTSRKRQKKGNKDDHENVMEEVVTEDVMEEVVTESGESFDKSSNTTSLICCKESLLPAEDLPITSKRSRGKDKVGSAAQSFNIPEIPGVMSGWISGFVELPVGAIKDAEGVNVCTQVFCVTACEVLLPLLSSIPLPPNRNLCLPSIYYYFCFLAWALLLLLLLLIC